MAQERIPGTAIWTDQHGNSWTIRLHFKNIGGREECVGVEMWAGTPPDEPESLRPEIPLRPLRAEDVRKPPLGKLIADSRTAAVADARATIDLDSDAALSPEATAFLRERMDSFGGSRPTGHPRVYGREHFVAVAEVYRLAWIDTGKPLVAIRDRWRVSKSAAAKWVAKCREMDLLPKKPGRGVAKIEEES